MHPSETGRPEIPRRGAGSEIHCPRCATPLDERVRDGVTIDACPSCRGIWLDRGELERLIARALDDDAQLGASRPYPDADGYVPPRGADPRARGYVPDSDVRHRGYVPDSDARHRGHVPDSDVRHRGYVPDSDARHRPVPGAPPRKRRWYESLGDLFD